MKPYTMQETFDTVVKHLFTQRKAAKHEYSDGDSVCSYRTHDGLKCAVGCLIPDEMYREMYEGNTASYLFDRDEDLYKLFDVPSFVDTIGTEPKVVLGEFLNRLQRVHDSFEPNLWYTQLECIARSYNFSTKVLDTVKPITEEELYNV
jgi:hypothetical protein